MQPVAELVVVRRAMVVTAMLRRRRFALELLSALSSSACFRLRPSLVDLR